MRKFLIQIITVVALLFSLGWLLGCADDPTTGDQDINDKSKPVGSIVMQQSGGFAGVSNTIIIKEEDGSILLISTEGNNVEQVDIPKSEMDILWQELEDSGVFKLGTNEKLLENVADAFYYDVTVQKGKNLNKFSVYAPELLAQKGDVRYDSAIQSIFKFAKPKLMKRITGIEGLVSDSTHNPVAKIKVQIVEGTASYPKIAVFTDEKGYYRLNGLSKGSFKVGFFNAGGETLGVKDASVKKGKITRLDFVVSAQPNEEFIIADMQIEDVEIQFLKSFPLQINLVVKGILGDGCTTLNEITQKRDGNTVYVNITTKRPKDVACIEIVKFITVNVKLDGGFPQGHYKIIVNNVVKELDIDGVIPDGEVGFLEGKVTIGPLCPVEPCNIPPGQVAKIYKSRKAIVYDQETKKKVIEANLDQKGEFSFSLSSGKYIVDISDAEGNPLPLDEPRIRMGNAIPEEVKIMPGQTTFIEFDIDTGIR